jgi:PAS domain S-box-containing protein
LNPESKEYSSEHVKLVFRSVRNVNRLIAQEKDRSKLLEGICKNLTENSGYNYAWIALLDKSGGLLKTVEAGLGLHFSPLWEKLKNGQFTSCAKKSFSQPGVVVTRNPESACADCPLSASYGERGAMTIRLEYSGQIFGIISVCIPKDLIVNKEEQILFQEVAGDIAFALHNIELMERDKRSDEALRESEDKYRTLFETTGTATIIIEDDTTISLANKEFENLSGYAKEEIEGKKSWTDFVADKNTLLRMKAYHYVRRIDPVAAPRNYEYKFIDRYGTVKNIFTTFAVIPGTDKSVGSFLDITELKQAEGAIRESEQRFRDLVQNSLTGISIVQDDRVVYQNPEQERLFGPLPRKFILADFDIIHPEDLEKVKKFYQGVTSGQFHTLDLDFRSYPPNPEGKKLDMKWVYCRVSPIEYQGRDAILINMMDMTNAKELEHLLRIQDKMSSLGRVAAGIAHEIRNPLSGINIYLDTLEKIYDDPESLEKVKGILTNLHSASAKIESVIRRVMDFSKPSEPKLALTDINQPIEDAIGLSLVTLRKSGIRLEKNLSGGLQPLYADPNLIEEVILNLITNAAEAMKNMDGEKKIEVASFVENRRIILKVSDSGPGVPSALKDKIFDPFYTTKSESTGIGLSLSHRIITDHGGSLEISRNKWGGAEFVIKMPIKNKVQPRIKLIEQNK